VQVTHQALSFVQQFSEPTGLGLDFVRRTGVVEQALRHVPRVFQVTPLFLTELRSPPPPGSAVEPRRPPFLCPFPRRIRETGLRCPQLLSTPRLQGWGENRGAARRQQREHAERKDAFAYHKNPPLALVSGMCAEAFRRRPRGSS